MNIKKIFVIGAGAMGAGIAQTGITKGFEVVLNDIDMAFVERAKANMEKAFTKNVEKGKMTEEDKAAALGRLTLTTDYALAADCDLVVEAIFENYDAKQNIFKKLEEIVREDCILATNTSSLSVTRIGSVLKNPARFIGLHFFNPVPVMKLLEIVVGLRTSDELVETAKEIGVALGKTPVVAKDNPGFIVNRCLVPYVNEGINILAEGVACPEDIDTGLKLGANHPMGPLELGDLIGLDIILAVMEAFYKDFGDPKYRPSSLLKKMVDSKQLGQKTGKGFYTYENGKKVK